MKQYRMKPFVTPPEFDVTVPGSKSITNRALLLAALAEGRSVLKGVLFSDDSRVFMDALQTLGYNIIIDEAGNEVTIDGRGTHIPEKKADIYVGSAGTAADGDARSIRRAVRDECFRADEQPSHAPFAGGVGEPRSKI